MSEEELITLENVSKRFYIQNGKDKTSGFSLINMFNGKKDFYALSNISFKVNKGEHIGILGKNGAGKTTLLKVISGITAPTSGSIVVKKNISPIFGYGAGFRQELTGNENVYLYGSLLGISKRHISANIQEIKDFSDLGDFFYMRLGTYSSGMKVRLAFSISLLLKPEILIQDESLSVGDASFIQKVYEKMESRIKEGMTLLFTSHSLPLLEKFCKRGIVLDHGKIVFDGDIKLAVEHYRDKIIANKI